MAYDFFANERFRRGRAGLAHITDLAPYADRISAQIAAGNRRSAASWVKQRCEHLERRSLARPIGPEKADDLALFYADIDAAHRLDQLLAGLVGAFETLGLDHQFGAALRHHISPA